MNYWHTQKNKLSTTNQMAEIDIDLNALRISIAHQNTAEAPIPTNTNNNDTDGAGDPMLTELRNAICAGQFTEYTVADD